MKIKYHKICKKEWDSAPKGYKSTIKGRKYILMMTNKGTSLVPIKFKKISAKMTKLKCWKLEGHSSQSIGESIIKSWQNKKNKDTVVINELDEGYGSAIIHINDEPKKIAMSGNLKSVENSAIKYMKKNERKRN